MNLNSPLADLRLERVLQESGVLNRAGLRSKQIPTQSVWCAKSNGRQPQVSSTSAANTVVAKAAATDPNNI
ncbi:MAG: hypothetical protein ACJAVI_003114, partial [Candidatus Azotimanducaceae bacterium]